MARSMLLGTVLALTGTIVLQAQEIRFEERAASWGLDFRHRNFATAQKHLPETMGGGVAFIDADNDGWLDVYLINGAPLQDSAAGPPNRFYRNLGTLANPSSGHKRFEDRTRESGLGHRGYGMGVAVGDFDGDGFDDIYLTNYGPNVLYRNLGNGRFQDVTARAGVGHSGWGTSAGFFDYDGDGDLDIYLVNYLEYDPAQAVVCRDYNLKEQSYCHPHHFPGQSDELYRNDGDATFTAVGKEAGIADPLGKGLGVVLADFDQDGLPDIYVANDSVSNRLYRNLGGGRFADVTLTSGTGYNGDGKAEAGMGLDAADVAGDSRPEIFVTNLDFETNTLYQPAGDWFYDDTAAQAGLGTPSLPWVGFGARFFDADNDGDLDLFVANGHILDNIASKRPWLSYPQINHLFLNQEGTFRLARADSGLSLKAVSRSLALGDVDNDGDLDLLIGNCGGPVHLLINQSRGIGGRISLRLRGVRSNRNGYGVRVSVQVQRSVRHYEKVGGAGYLSAHDQRIHIGLGSASQAEVVEIIWPSGRRQRLENVAAGSEITLREP